MSFFLGAVQQDGYDIISRSITKLGLSYLNASNCLIEKKENIVIGYSQTDCGKPSAIQYFAGGSKFLLFEGIIFNKSELATKLGIISQDISTNLLVALCLEKWGKDACKYLIGNYAFVCWDLNEKHLLLACDPTGAHTLYYTINEVGVIFSTKLTAILALLPKPPALNQDTLLRALLDHRPITGQTWFNNLHQLPFGHMLSWTHASYSLETFWQPDFQRQLSLKKDQEYVEAGRALLDLVVAEQLACAGKFACHLSGGLDSSGLAATLAKFSPQVRFDTVTTIPASSPADMPIMPGRLVNEAEHALSLTNQLPHVEHHVVAAGKLRPFDWNPLPLFWLMGRPMRGTTNISWFATRHQKLVDLKVDTVFSGIAGNATFSYRSIIGGTNLLSISHLQMLWYRYQYMRREGFTHTSLLPKAVSHLARNLLNLILPSASSNPISNSNNIFRPEFITSLNLEGLLVPPLPPTACTSKDQYKQWLLMHETCTAKSLIWGVHACLPYKIFDPLGDRRILEFCLSLPREQYVHHGLSRSFARRLLADRLPAKIVYETRTGKQNAEWFNRLTPLRPYYADAIERFNQSSLLREIYDLPKLKYIVDHWPNHARQADENVIGGILNRGVHIGEFVLWVENGCPQPVFTSLYD